MSLIIQTKTEDSKKGIAAKKGLVKGQIYIVHMPLFLLYISRGIIIDSDTNICGQSVKFTNIRITLKSC